MPIYPDIIFPLNFSQKDQIIYTQIINRICAEYYKQAGEYKKPFTVTASNQGVINYGEHGALAITDKADDNITIYLPTDPDNIELTAYSSLIAHELAHLWLKGIFGANGKEWNNLVHYAANHSLYLNKKTVWFIQWSTPYLPIMVFDIAGLQRDSTAIMLKCTMENGSPNVYW